MSDIESLVELMEDTYMDYPTTPKKKRKRMLTPPRISMRQRDMKKKKLNKIKKGFVWK